jgi:hypothetical protein
MDRGIAAFEAWAVGQSFAGAGPVGHYLAMVYGNPGTGIPEVEWGHDAEFDFSPAPSVDGMTNNYADTTFSTDQGPVGVNSTTAEPRTLEHLDRGEPGGTAPQDGIQIVNVYGTPRDKSSGFDFRYRDGGRLWIPHSDPPGPEMVWRLPLFGPPPPPRRRAAPRPRKPIVTVPEPGRPELDPLPPPPSAQPTIAPPDSYTPYFDTDIPSTGVPGGFRTAPVTSPFLSDVGVPEDVLPRGAWAQADRPENATPPRQELLAAGRIETAPVERSFWSRGGTGLAFGALTAATGLAVLFW